MNRIIVTGGAGFIGSNLVHQLQATWPEARILVIDDFRVGTMDNLCCENPPWGPKTFRGEVIARPLGELDLGSLIASFDAEVVFHLASITETTIADQTKMMRDNVEPFDDLLTAAVEENVKLVWASSAATYGTQAKGAVNERRPFRLEDAGHPANVYGFSKWIMENLHRRTHTEHPDSHIVGLRYFNVFGPGEACKGSMASMAHQLSRQMLEGKRPRIIRDGEQARDHVFVGDVVDATIAAADDRAASGIYNVGAGATLTFNQIIQSLNQALETHLEAEYFENPYRFFQQYTCADLTETRTALQWSPRHDPRKAIMDYARGLKREWEEAKSSNSKIDPPRRTNQ